MKSLFATVLLLSASTLASGGSIRYELPSLLGEHTFDGYPSVLNASEQVITPFGFYDATDARLVVEGRVTPGKAHGDGSIREGTSFDLLPSVSVLPSFANLVAFSTETTPETFRHDNVYPNPFVPEITPLPNPDGYPTHSFWVYISVGPSLSTQYPPRIDPTGFNVSDGVVVDVPIVAHVDTAYIVFSGPTIVPEPSGLVILLSGVSIYLSVRGMRNQRDRDTHPMPFS